VYITKEKIVTLNVIKMLCAEIGPKHFDKLEPEPGPTYNFGPHTEAGKCLDN